ncbi:bifunctional precorrin-2 dehydrogenase/sirohydrochlorin ferrochelatase [Paenibacillus aurantius]|uniref:precorrin-2 dehydrogenase n=1 Tax=Paenibacillus aurantius TaxID=2918900 RepID=A0AA96REX8_9BACL|nr:bifunctional precorrin-2 dehydrogenase/sirohydrochlorin ferrochelatase [Paenibacillus aurantius]WNQ12940.1 bifunctional precorrin-2 dehydrogenase/sirohydrochlorin ferrochelatase [Paenibacillus aurantius]
MTYYPVMLNLQGKKAVVVGGGPVGERKTSGLLDARAKVTVISPEATEGLRQLAAEGAIRMLNREYRPGDLQEEEAFLVMAATGSPSVNRFVAEEAREAGVLLNAADDGGTGDFLVPSVLRRGRLLVALSTSGAGPAAARKLIRELDSRYGPEYETYVDFLAEFRTAAKKRIEDQGMRGRLLRSLSECDIPELIRTGRFLAFREEVLERLGCSPGSLSGILEKYADKGERP